jgi:formate hydrogenlyase subunit 6/NADH:ubiquinone oxidoreductase subunit I
LSYTIKGGCIVCGICEMICPERAIIEDEDANIYRIDPKKCTDCGECEDACPVDAIERSD